MMASEMPDSPMRSALWCPGCDLEADPTRDILQVHWCFRHAPSRDGLDDAHVTVDMIAGVNGEAEAVNCRAVQALIR